MLHLSNKMNITFLCFSYFGIELSLFKCKNNHLIDILFYIERNYNFNLLLFLDSSTACCKPCLNFSHCFFNHSPISCRFIVSTNVFSSTGFRLILNVSFFVSNLRLCIRFCFRLAIRIALLVGFFRLFFIGIFHLHVEASFSCWGVGMAFCTSISLETF